MKKILIAFLALFFAINLSGCISVKKSGTAVNNLGGVFVSEDRIENWKNKSLLMTPAGTAGNISEVDVYFMKFDPSDENTIYLGTRAHGLYYSYNGAEGWNKAEKLPTGFVRDLAIDTENKCILYAAVESRIYKSEDCARTWKTAYYTDSVSRFLTAVAVDPSKPANVYAGLSDGSLIMSVDRGVSWKVLKKFSDRVQRIFFDPKNSDLMYVGITTDGVWQSKDNGSSWQDLNKAMKDFADSDSYFDFAISNKNSDFLLYANKFGLLKSLDAGITWSQVKLLTRAGSEVIYSVAIDPTNDKILYYATNQAVYKSLDGGDSWKVKKLSTTRVGQEILVQPSAPNKIYLGVKTVENK